MQYARKRWQLVSTLPGLLSGLVRALLYQLSYESSSGERLLLR